MNYLLSFMKILVTVYFSLYFIFHVLMFLTPETVRHMIFQGFAKYPFVSYDNPPKYGHNNVHNFYIDTEPEVRIGIWHFVPASLHYNYEKDSKNSLSQHFERFFRQAEPRPVIIYVHGNDRDRTGRFRTRLCQSLCDLGYHIFAIDVRGYGDSTGSPSETGAVNDVITLFNFIKRYQKESNIFIWGHSLGTGITSHTAKVLSEFNSPPAGIILEAPFCNISQAARDYIVSPMFLNNAWILAQMEKNMDEIKLHFNNAENLLKTKSRILIMHAEDDWLIPQDHSREIKKLLDEKRDKRYGEVRLLEFHSGLSLGHNSIYTHKELYPIIKEFIEKNSEIKVEKKD